MERSELQLLNDIIYKIYSIDNLHEMRCQFLELLKYLIPADILTFYLSSEKSPFELADPVGIGLSDYRWQYYLDNFQDIDHTRWVFAVPNAGVYRESDLMNDDERIKTEYYKKMFEPDGLHHSVIMTVIYNESFLGTVVLFRKKGKENFSDDEVLYLNLLKDHLAYRLYRENLTKNQSTSSYPEQDVLKSNYNLTSREAEITQFLLTGASRDQICSELFITQNTLKKHTVNIYKKFGVNSYRELLKILNK